MEENKILKNLKQQVFDKGIAGWLFTALIIVLVVGGLHLLIGSGAAQPPPAPTAEEEVGLPWGYIAIGATLLLLLVLWMPRKQPAGGEGGEQEVAWWATKKGHEVIVALLLLFLIMAGLMYVGIKALLAGGFLFIAWMVYRYYFAGEEEGRVITTQKLADEIADEFEYRGMKLDSHEGVYGVFLPGLGVHLVQLSTPTTLTFILKIVNGKVRERGGPLCCTLHEAIEKIEGKKDLWMPPVAEGGKKPQITQIGAEGGGD